jgi:hypothetical protein
MVDPEKEYIQQIDSLKQSLAKILRMDTWFANARLILFVAMVIAGIAASYNVSFSLIGLAVTVGVFLGLIVFHAILFKRKDEVETSIRYFETGLLRIRDEWAGKGISGDSYKPSSHYYSEDLDIFGNGSLFELLNTCRTQSGEHSLSDWLCNPADSVEIQARQEAVQECVPNVSLRLDLGRIGQSVRKSFHENRLSFWVNAEYPLPGSGAYRALIGLSVISVMSLILWLTKTVPGVVPVFMLTIDLLVLKWLSPKVIPIVEQLGHGIQELKVMTQVLKRLEAESFTSTRLKSLRDQLIQGPESASNAIKKLDRLFVWLELYRNPMFAPLAWFSLWVIHFSYAIQRWRNKYGDSIHKWVEAMGELEALIALSTYAYEHPDDTFPDVKDTNEFFVGDDLGHPLISGDGCVRNTVHLIEKCPLWIVSGSNMSGKSTLLRVIGINAVMAMAGAPVRAKALVMKPFKIGASIHVLDSIQSGMSHFYAEIHRLKDMLNLAQDHAVLFLIDEILHGTNSHDRLKGSDGIIRALLNKGAMGLVTTHDLALVEVADSMTFNVKNVHFDDRMGDKELQFDYQLKEGVVQHSNALALMRSIGLDV